MNVRSPSAQALHGALRKFQLLFTIWASTPFVGQAQTNPPAPAELPKVLLMGDSIAGGYTEPVRKLLEGKAVIYTGHHGGLSTVGLQKLDEWLGQGKWAIIHFNWGLNDLEGKRVLPDLYGQNIRELVKRLKKTGARLIWCSTTPVPIGRVNSNRDYRDVPIYNEVARKIMEENRIEINDLYSFALPRLQELQIKEDVHFTEHGYRLLAEQVVAVLIRSNITTSAIPARSTPAPSLPKK